MLKYCFCWPNVDKTYHQGRFGLGGFESIVEPLSECINQQIWMESTVRPVCVSNLIALRGLQRCLFPAKILTLSHSGGHCGLCAILCSHRRSMKTLLTEAFTTKYSDIYRCSWQSLAALMLKGPATKWQNTIQLGKSVHIVKLGHPESCFLSPKLQNILTVKENEVMLKTTLTAAVPHSWTHILSPFISPSSCWHHNRGSLRCRSIPSSITLHLMPEPSTGPGGKTGDRNHNVVERWEPSWKVSMAAFYWHQLHFPQAEVII